MNDPTDSDTMDLYGEIAVLERRLKAIQDYSDQCALLRQEPTTAGLKEALNDNSAR